MVAGIFYHNALRSASLILHVRVMFGDEQVFAQTSCKFEALLTGFQRRDFIIKVFALLSTFNVKSLLLFIVSIYWVTHRAVMIYIIE